MADSWTIWSDDDLDLALTTLHSEVDTDEHALAEARAQFTAHPAEEPTRHRMRWALAVAAVVVLIAGFLVVQTVPIGTNPPAATAAAESLNSAADKIQATDPPLRPGQCRYIAKHEWYLKDGKDLAFLWEHQDESWVPVDRDEDWLVRSTRTGQYKIIVGNEERAKELGITLDERFSWDVRKPCPWPGSGARPCEYKSGGWGWPTPDWVAGLPRDPQALFDNLRATVDAQGNSSFESIRTGVRPEDQTDRQMLRLAAQTLDNGLLIPADLREAIYRALAKIPGLKIIDREANLDGRIGTAYGVTGGSRRFEIIVDPATGEFIGQRDVAATTREGIPVGTVIDVTAVTTGIADTIGVKPAG